MTTTDHRQVIADYFQGQSDWRSQKAEEYPDDHRNEANAYALAELAEFVRQAPENHPVIAAVADYGVYGDVFGAGEESGYMVSRYGFGHWTEDDHAGFLSELAKVLRRERAEVDLEEAVRELRLSTERTESARRDRDDAIREASAAGVPLRSIADLAQISYQAVGRIIGGVVRRSTGRGGHAPGVLRDAFVRFIETSWAENGGKTIWYPTPDQTTPFGDDERQVPVEWLLGQLWNTTDALPSSVCNDLDIPQGSSYAQAVREISRYRKSKGSRTVAEASHDR